MMYLLDTDMFSLAFRGTHGVRGRVDAARAAGHAVSIGIMTRVEAVRGRMNAMETAATPAELIRLQELLERTERFVGTFEVVPFDAGSAERFERLETDKPFRKLRRADMLIACVALARDATLVTRNTKDFAPIPGLTVENWAD